MLTRNTDHVVGFIFYLYYVIPFIFDLYFLSSLRHIFYLWSLFFIFTTSYCDTYLLSLIFISYLYHVISFIFYLYLLSLLTSYCFYFFQYNIYRYVSILSFFFDFIGINYLFCLYYAILAMMVDRLCRSALASLLILDYYAPAPRFKERIGKIYTFIGTDGKDIYVYIVYWNW